MKRYFLTGILTIFMYSTISTGTSLNKTLIKETVTIITYEINFNVEISDSWKARSIASRFNNPGNLRSIYDSRFVKYDNLMDGYTALVRDIRYKQLGQSRYCDGNTSIAEFVHIYAPPFENNTIRYIEEVCRYLNIDRTTQIKDVWDTDLARAIIRVEDPVLYKEMFTKNIEIKEIYSYD